MRGWWKLEISFLDLPSGAVRKCYSIGHRPETSAVFMWVPPIEVKLPAALAMLMMGMIDH
jgi:hypothetical protein